MFLHSLQHNFVINVTPQLFNFVVVMVTPIMTSNIGWATYLVFAIVNACFLPVVFLFYPETAGRSLEEIDIIFAKGYLEDMTYVKASRELPRLSDRQIEELAIHYGLGDPNSQFHMDKELSEDGATVEPKEAV